MPVEYNETLWRALYAEAGRGDPPVVITYGAAWESLNAARFDLRLDWLLDLGIKKNDTVLVIGSAFGYGMQRLYDVGVRVWGIEESPWIWDPLNHPEWANGLMRNRTARDWVGSGSEQRMLDAVGAPEAFNWVIDEDAISGQHDGELQSFLNACEDRLLDDLPMERIIHMVSKRQLIPGDSAINWKSMADWSALAPDHQWLDLQNGEMFV